MSGVSLTPMLASDAEVPLADLIVDARRDGYVPHDEINLQAQTFSDGWAYASDLNITWGIGDRSTVRVKASPNKSNLELTGKAFLHRGAPVQTVDIRIDGVSVRTVRLLPWKRTYRVALPPGTFPETTADLELRYRWARSPSKVLSGSQDDRRLATAWDSIRLGGKSSVADAALESTADTLDLRGVQRVRVPLRAKRPLSFEADQVVLSGGAALRVSLDRLRGSGVTTRFESDPGNPVALAETPEGEDLKHVRLTLEVEGPRTWWRKLLNVGRQPRAQLSNPLVRADTIQWPSRELAKMGYFSQIDDNEATPPQLVVLWVIDTLRADHLSTYGYEADTSPQLDRFAADAVTYDRGVAQSSWTRPSVTSILTGQLLHRHGVYDKRDALSGDAITLPEILHDAGYTTAAFLTNGNLRRVGLEQGFSTFRQFPEGRAKEFHQPAQGVVDVALRWLDRNAGQPAFVYLHLTDPHLPYIPAPGFEPSSPVEDASIGTLEGFRAAVRARRRETQDLLKLYDAEIRQVDDAFGRLMDGLERRGLYEDSLVVVSADHGEEFLDHGDWQHGKSLYAEQLGVPMVIRWPQGQSPHAPGSRVSDLAAHVDLMPTVLAAVGVTPSPQIQGRDLARSSSRPTLTELEDRYRATLDERYKLLTDVEGNPLALYDNQRDPGDQVDVLGSHVAVVEYHRRLQEIFVERSAGQVTVATAEQDEETLENLRALGYVE